MSDAPTAPQPVSPKCVITLCLRVAQICLLLVSTPGAPSPPEGCGLLRAVQGMNSTRIQRFCGLAKSVSANFSQL